MIIVVLRKLLPNICSALDLFVTASWRNSPPRYASGAPVLSILRPLCSTPWLGILLFIAEQQALFTISHRELSVVGRRHSLVMATTRSARF